MCDGGVAFRIVSYSTNPPPDTEGADHICVSRYSSSLYLAEKVAVPVMDVLRT